MKDPRAETDSQSASRATQADRQVDQQKYTQTASEPDSQHMQGDRLPVRQEGNYIDRKMDSETRETEQEVDEQSDCWGVVEQPEG